MSPALLFPRLGLIGVLLLPSVVLADNRVSLTARADPAYTERKYGPDGPRTETYVVMQGRYFEGHTVDRSIERMPFRRVAEYFAPELAKQRFLPAPSLGQADLLIVVHWGTTLPVLSVREMTARTSSVTDVSTSAATLGHESLKFGAESAPDSPFSLTGSTPGDTGMTALLGLSDSSQTQLQLDRHEQVAEQAGAEMTRANNVALLGYTDDLHRMRRDLLTSAAEQSLRHDLNSERYFIILKAYDIRASTWTRGAVEPVWSMHLNVSSPGNNFHTALNRMSAAAVSYVGRTTSEVRSVRPDVREGRVDLGPLVILQEVK